MLVRPGFPILLTALVIAGCGSRSASNALAGGASAATDACSTQAAPVASVYGPQNGLAAGFAVTAADVTRWQETRHDPNGPQPQSRFRDSPAAARLYVCYFDGSFIGFSPPDGGGSSTPYERIILIVDDKGEVVLDAAGFKRTLPIVDPARP